MLDICYCTIESFRLDCVLCNLDADVILASDEYVVIDTGAVVAADLL